MTFCRNLDCKDDNYIVDTSAIVREKDVRKCVSDVRESMGGSVISRRINQAN